MFFPVLRLLAVYFGTAAASLYLVHRLVSQLRLRVCLFLALAPFLLVGKALLTAGIYAPIDIPYQAHPLATHAASVGTQVTQTPILSDVVYQEVPWRKAVREAVKNGRLPLWNRFVLAGEPLLAVQQPVVLYPATWIGFLLPLAQAWTFEMAMRFFLALLSAYLFLRELECGELPALLGAVGWAFSDYLVFYLGYPLTPAAAPFPLLLLGLRRLVTEKSRRAVVLTTVALLLILTSGHPETLLHSVAGAGIYFLFEIGFAGRGRRLRPVLLSLLAGVLALGLSAVLLLPLAEALPQTWEHFIRSQHYAHVRKSFPIRESIRHALPNVMPYAYGVSGKGAGVPGFVEPSSYAGSLLWSFALLGFFSQRRERWPLLALGFLGASVGARFIGVTDAISSLPFFDIGLNDRMIFLGAFALAALAALGAQQLREKAGVGVLVATAVGAVVLLTVLYYVLARPRLPLLEMPPGYLRDRWLLQAVPLLLSVILWFALPRRRVAREGLGAVLLLLLVQRGLEEREVYPTYRSEAFYPELRSLQKIPRNTPYRMTAIGFIFVPNIGALYELEDVRGYEAMTFLPLFETYSLWCVHQPVWFNRVDDPTKPFLSFLNVRYFLAPPGYPPPTGWRVVFDGDEGVLLENPGVLPRAFAPRFLGYETDRMRRLALLAGIQDFGEYGVVGQNPPRGVSGGGWQRNGRMSLRISSYLPQEMTLDLEAQEPGLVATSVTSWPGWKLTVDGVKSGFVSYNHAFLAFRVAAGHHRAVLRYWPDSFVLGAVVSAVALLLSLFLLYRGVKHGRPPME